MMLTNDFHNTSVELNMRRRKHLSVHQVRRARRALCGIADCTCGSIASERGPQSYDGRKFRLMARQDGGADIEYMED